MQRALWIALVVAAWVCALAAIAVRQAFFWDGALTVHGAVAVSVLVPLAIIYLSTLPDGKSQWLLVAMPAICLVAYFTDPRVLGAGYLFGVPFLVARAVRARGSALLLLAGCALSCALTSAVTFGLLRLPTLELMLLGPLSALPFIVESQGGKLRAPLWLFALLLLFPPVGSLAFAVLLVRAALTLPERRSVLCILVGVVPTLFLCQLITGFTWLLSVDIHLHDTLFAVAPIELGGAFIAFTVVATRRPPPLGVILLAIGTVGVAVFFVLLGTMGMPRRYWKYFDIFSTRQHLATASAVVAFIGLALSTVSIARGSSRSPAAPPADPGST